MKKSVELELKQQETAIEFVKDWSKWLIGLNFTSGTGCIVVLQQGVSNAIKIYLIAAIFLFTLSTIITALVLATLPILIQRLPLKSKTGDIRSVYDYWIFSSLFPIKSLIAIQLVLFALGLIFLFVWVILKPAK